MFQKKLAAAVAGENIIYVITEKEHLSLLPQGAIRILVTADLELIKSRFAQRMQGNLPAPVAAMLERNHGCFDSESHDFRMIAGETNIDALCTELLQKINLP